MRFFESLFLELTNSMFSFIFVLTAQQDIANGTILIYKKRSEILVYFNTAENENEVAVWQRGLVERKISDEVLDTLQFDVCDVQTRQLIKTTSIFNLAKHDEPSKSDRKRWNPGRRVIAERQLKRLPHSAEILNSVTQKYSKNFYPGFIIEMASSDTKNRFLIIFDDGHVQFIRKYHIRDVFGINPGNHAHPNAMKFLRYSLRKRPILHPEIGELLRVELNGKFETAQVIEIDCDRLIKMKFRAVDRTEWLLNWSPRFSQIWRYVIIQNLYNNFNDSFDLPIEEHYLSSSESEHSGKEDDLISQIIPGPRPKRKWYTSKLENIEESMLSRPLLKGWKRENDGGISYISPCGKIFKNIKAVYEYLIATNSELDIDSFTFNSGVDCLRMCKTVCDKRHIKSEVSLS